MMGKEVPAVSRPAHLTMGELLRQFLPLSLSDMIMVLAGPIIIAGLARLPNQEVHLAAYGVAEAVAILIESPIIMLLHAANALSRDPVSFKALRRFMLWANLGLTLFYAVLAFTPLYDVIFRGWLGQPAAVADAARPAFQVMLLWPAAIGWRRYFQGMLIARKRSARVGAASVYRLVSLAATVVIGVLLRWPGAVVGGAALAVSVIVEAAIVTWFARNEKPEGEPLPHLPHSLGAVAAWYAPLALTAILIWVSKPAINGGLARATEADLSLAAWPAIWTTAMLVANAIRMIQQVVITQATSPENYRVLTRFTWWAGVAASGLMALIGLSPAGGQLLTQVTGLSSHLTAVAVPALRLLVLFPLGIALQNHYQGLLIRSGRTPAVNLGALVGSGVLFATLLLGVRAGWLGTVAGAAATMVGQAAEVGVLYLLTTRERAALTATASA
jgi:progressive ankylosis protein